MFLRVFALDTLATLGLVGLVRRRQNNRVGVNFA